MVEKIRSNQKSESLVMMTFIDGVENAKIKQIISGDLNSIFVPVNLHLDSYDLLYADQLSKKAAESLSQQLDESVTVTPAGCTLDLVGNLGRIFHGLFEFKISRSDNSEVLSASLIFKPQINC